MIMGTRARSEDQASGTPWVFIVHLAMISSALLQAENMPAAVIKVAEVFTLLHARNACRDVISGAVSQILIIINNSSNIHC